MKVIISGGGTGGHIYPAIAIAHALQHLHPDVSILFVGAQGKMEMKKVPEAGYRIEGLNITGLQRSNFWANLLLPFRLMASLWKSHRILRSFRPDVVIGTGGYASAPMLFMASQHKIPTIIQEQNAIPGLTNRLLGRYVDKICVAYEGMEAYFPASKLALTGNPVRQQLFDTKTQSCDAGAQLGLTPGKPCLLVMGGSLGAGTINEGILRSLDLLTNAGLQLLWITGEAHFSVIKKQIPAQYSAHIRLYPFIATMHLAYAAADIVVARAGAGTIAELCLVQKPTILIPSPNVTNDHQTKNAMALVHSHAALLVKDDEAIEKMGHAITQLLGDQQLQKILSSNMQALARPQAAATIAAMAAQF